MNDNTKLSDEDKKLFREAMREVQPLGHSHKLASLTAPPPPPPASAKTIEPSQPALSFSLSDNYQDTVTVDQLLAFHVPGVSPKIIKSLRHGTYPIHYTLDLHGTTVAIARLKLCQALTHCYQHQLRCLLVIHGKSHRQDQIPILKNHVNHWLKQIPVVLAFYTAQARDGGTGALYVWLKRRTV